MNEWAYIASSFCAATNPEATVLYVAPQRVQVNRMLETLYEQYPLIRENTIEKTQSQIQLENGSRIIGETTTREGDRLRGRHPDLIVTDRRQLDDAVDEKVLQPMLACGECSMIDTPV